MTWRSATGNWVRSGLTTLGVFMGVAAVSATLNIQSITSRQIENKLAERDKPFVEASGWIKGVGPLEIREEDQEKMKKVIPEVRTISTTSTVWGLDPIQWNGREAEGISAVSVPLNYLDTTGRRMLKGRFFNQTDFDQYSTVAIVDQQLAEILFENNDPRNQTIYAAGNRLLVIGVTESKSRGEGDKSQGTLWITQNMSKVLQSGGSWTEVRIGTH
ncbi:MAG: ABC transporter permease, partial [Leptolyngbyaceae cyanobacterium bins.59]|nr:ABC transporter permease [Leptolyngbyaceae cyanobacterium bins.59]